MQNNMQNQKMSEPLNKNLAMMCGTVILAAIIISGTVLYNNSKPSNTWVLELYE